MCLISIIMPAFNAGLYIRDSIQSVLDQSLEDWELIIINDGSTDDTLEIAFSFSKNDPRIKVKNQENKRLGAARNCGIKHSSGKWISFLDSDDLWHKDMLQFLITASEEFKTVGVFYTDGSIFYGNDLVNLSPYPTRTGKIFTGDEMFNIEFGNNYIPILSVMVKRSLIEEIGYQEERKYFHGCEDWDYWLRLARIGAIFYGVPVKLFYYRRHSSNMSGNSTNMLLAKVSVLIKNYDAQFIGRNKALLVLKPSIYELVHALLGEGRGSDLIVLLDELKSSLAARSFYLIKVVIKRIPAQYAGPMTGAIILLDKILLRLIRTIK